jgi:hypothetical protein
VIQRPGNQTLAVFFANETCCLFVSEKRGSFFTGYLAPDDAWQEFVEGTEHNMQGNTFLGNTR